MSDPTPVRAGEDAGREATDTGTEWFWRVVDSNAEVGLPSIEEDALRLLCRWANRASAAEAEVARLRERLEIVRAYDGEGKQIPFPAGMEHLDGIACRDETIKGLDALVSALRERVARLEEENGRLRIAFHDATRRPLGVTPDSGAEFYDQRMADEAEARRPRIGCSDAP